MHLFPLSHTHENRDIFLFPSLIEKLSLSLLFFLSSHLSFSLFRRQRRRTHGIPLHIKFHLAIGTLQRGDVRKSLNSQNITKEHSVLGLARWTGTIHNLIIRKNVPIRNKLRTLINPIRTKQNKQHRINPHKHRKNLKPKSQP